MVLSIALRLLLASMLICVYADKKKDDGGPVLNRGGGEPTPAKTDGHVDVEDGDIEVVDGEEEEITPENEGFAESDPNLESLTHIDIEDIPEFQPPKPASAQPITFKLPDNLPKFDSKAFLEKYPDAVFKPEKYMKHVEEQRQRERQTAGDGK
ncbi:uncharacterized protein [Ptychodera flava]|uniref:uncharacterized protein n=1 Tax=Ptychodera flava TaxID=63121 RepID=UPI00396A83D1